MESRREIWLKHDKFLLYYTSDIELEVGLYTFSEIKYLAYF